MPSLLRGDGIVGRRAAAITRSRWLLAPLSCALALAGAAVVELHRRRTHGFGSPPAFSWILFGLAALALYFAAGDAKRLMPASVTLRGLAGAGGRRAIACFAAAGVLAAASIPQFVRLNDSNSAREAGWAANNASWLLYLASLACFAAGVAFWQRRDHACRPAVERGWPATLPRRVELAVIGVLTAVALALRLPALGSIPHGLWFDEAANGLVGKELLAHGALHSVFIGDFPHGALYFYALGGGLDLVGDSIWMLRVLPALAGSLAVPLLYLLASRLYGWQIGLAAGGFLGISAWSITFSRFGLFSMVTVCLDIAVYLCFVLGLRTGSVRWYGVGGVLLGFALQGYYVAQVVPVVLLLLLLHLLVFSGGRRAIARVRAGVAVFLAGAVLAFLPLATFAAQHPGTYRSRMSTTSIFSENGRGGQSHPVRTSLRKHLLMFNFQGDSNGRHNLPGSPMLDWLTAAFFFSGLGLCLVRLRSWQYFLPLAWFAAALSGGVFSLVYEAPQGGRTVENSVVTALLAGIFLGEAWRVLGRVPRPRMLAPAAAAFALVAVGAAAAMNVHKYFGRQANDSRVWSDMGAGTLDAGRLIRRYSGTDDVWLSDRLVGQPAVRFLAPRASPLVWSGMYQFPFRGRDGRDVVLLVPADATTDLALLAETYPHARFEVFRAPDGLPLLRSIFIPARDVGATHGITRRRGPARSVRLVTVVRIPSFGRYLFAWRGRRARIAVDGRTVGKRPRRLASGLHWIEIDTQGRAKITALRFGTRASGLRPLDPTLVYDPKRVWPRGLRGAYRPGIEFGGPARLARIDPFVAIEFHELLLPPPFTVEWRGELYAPFGGLYRLGMQQIDSARLFVDGHRLLDNAEPGTLQLETTRLSRGWHPIRILYRGVTGHFNAYLYWTPPSGIQSVVPAAYLRPFAPPASFRPPLPSLAGSDGSPPAARIVFAGA